jgi:hypothetical protein
MTAEEIARALGEGWTFKREDDKPLVFAQRAGAFELLVCVTVKQIVIVFRMPFEVPQPRQQSATGYAQCFSLIYDNTPGDELGAIRTALKKASDEVSEWSNVLIGCL